MNILVLNSGSSSVKVQLISMPEKKMLATGLVERIGLPGSRVKFEANGIKRVDERAIENHESGLKLVAELLLDPELGLLNSADEIEAVGHRVVHGGSLFSETVEIDENVKQQIKDLFGLAPLHNPHNLKGIEVAETIFTKARQIAVFDTAFHQSIPEEAYRYAIHDRFLDDHQIRLYGFHGTSHKYVSERAIASMDSKSTRIVTVHLGNGCSATAVKDGKSLDHSLGFGPMNGLIMGTRSGDIDQSVIFFLMNELNYTNEQVQNLLQQESGMLGLTGYSDLREIESKAEQGDKKCQLALRMNAYRVKKFIGAYAAAMNGLDALVFTAGIGENSDVMRRLICQDMDYLGISLNEEKNAVRGDEMREVHQDGSKVRIMIIPTNEELEIAIQSYQLIT